MKLLSLVAFSAVLLNGVSAHYRFWKLINNGVVTGEYQYVRPSTNTNSPITDSQSNDMRCNQGGGTSGSTQTLTVAAGTTVGFQADIALIHPGPIAVYLGKAPSTAAAWDGSGQNWFKIYEIGAVITSTAITFPASNQQTFTFKLPSTIPAGEYLLRIEHIALHSTGQPQWYISCAQLKITGGGSANPAKVSIPGYVTGNESGLTLSIYWPIPTSYTVPGPAVFTG